MNNRTVKVTLYLSLELVDKQTHSLLRKTYIEHNATFTVPNATADEDPANLVPDSTIFEHLNKIFDNQEQTIVPRLMSQYPDLPEFIVGKVELATKKVFFEDTV